VNTQQVIKLVQRTIRFGVQDATEIAAGLALHLGVDPRGNGELLSTEVHGKSMPCPLKERDGIPVGSP